MTTEEIYSILERCHRDALRTQRIITVLLVVFWTAVALTGCYFGVTLH